MSKRRQRNPSGGFLQWAMIGGAVYFAVKSGMLGRFGIGSGLSGATGIRSVTGTGLFPNQGDNKIWMSSGGLQIFKPGDIIDVKSGTGEHFNDGFKHVLAVSATEIVTQERYSNWGPGPLTITAV